MKNEKIAIIGIGMIVPKALNKEQFWQNVLEGKNCITEVPADHWDSSLYYSPDRKAKDKTFTKIGGFIQGFAFNSLKYRIPPVTAKQISRLQQMTLEAAHMALEDAGYDKKAFSSARVATVFGNAMGPTIKDKTDLRVYRFKTAEILHKTPSFASLPKSQQENILKEYEKEIDAEILPITEDTLPGELANIIAGRVANVFNFNGPNMTVDAACASSLAALDYSVSGLRERKFDIAITGGADDMVQPTAFVRFSKLGALSADGSFPFDERANGFVMAEAVTVYILKRLSDAERDGDKIYALINAIGSASDGKGKGITAPNPKGQKMAIEHAFSQVEYNPGEIDFVEAHGTSTRVGDAAEVQVLKDIFGPYLQNGKKIGLTSVKSQIGHSKAAAGAVSMAKTALALYNKVLPGSINCEKENPAIDLNSFYVIKKSQEWKKEKGIRRADVSAFGFGGTNFHVLMEEYTGKNHPLFTGKDNEKQTVFFNSSEIQEDPCNPFEKLQPEAITIHGDTPQEVIAAALREAREVFSRMPEKYPLACYAQHSMACPRKKFGVSIVAKSPKDFIEKVKLLEKKADTANWEKPVIQFKLKQIYPFNSKANKAKVGLLFPGQGSQSVNMLRDLAAKYRIVKETFDEADEIMMRMIGIKLTEAIWSKPGEDKAALQKREDDIRQTKLTQPAMMTADIAMYRLLCEYGIKPDMAIGHSLGEYAAATAAGVFTFENGLRAVTDRAKEMSSINVADPGKMAFVALGCDKVDEELAKLNAGYVISANKNCPTQTVIAGEAKAVNAAVAHFKSMGIEAGEIAVSHAFHSAVIEPAAKPYRAFLQNIPINLPTLPILSNVTSDFYPNDKQGIYDLLVKQISSPVEFIKQLEHMYELGVRTFIECGPKRVLTGFATSTLKDKPDVTILASNHPKRGGIIEFDDMLANMTALGIPVDWRGKDPLTGDRHFNPYFRNWAIANVSAVFSAEGRSSDPEEEKPVCPPDSPQGGGKGLPEAQLKDLMDSVAKLQEKIQSMLASEKPAAKQEAIPASIEPVKAPAQTETIKASAKTDKNNAAENTALKAKTEEMPKKSDEIPSGQPASGISKSGMKLSEEEITEHIVNLFIEKTGYTKELLNLDSDLEADLGIDTIKQAEILSELREYYKISAEGQPSVKDYPTIRHCIKFVYEKQSSGQDIPMPNSLPKEKTEKNTDSVAAEKPEKQAADDAKNKISFAGKADAADSSDKLLTEEEVTEQILNLFIEKTGYTKEMLDLDSDMEADLGIDTIKQAEMLAQIREQYKIPADSSNTIKDYPTIRHCIKFVTEKQHGANSRQAGEKRTALTKDEKSDTESDPEPEESQSKKQNAAENSSLRESTDSDHILTENQSSAAVSPDKESAQTQNDSSNPAAKTVFSESNWHSSKENIFLEKDFSVISHENNIMANNETAKNSRKRSSQEEPLLQLIQEKEKEDRLEKQLQAYPDIPPVLNLHPARHIRYVPVLIPAPVEQENFFKLAYKKPAIIFSEDLDLAKAFRAELSKRQIPSYIFTSLKTKAKDSIQYDNSNPAEMEITFRAFAGTHKDIQGIFFLNGCIRKYLSADTHPSKDLLNYSYPLFLAVKVFKPALDNVPNGLKSFLAVITTANGKFGHLENDSIDPVYASIHGMALCFRKELPNTMIKIIDFEPSAANNDIAHKTFNEILYSDCRTSVCFSGNKRNVIIFNPELLEKKNPVSLKGKRILITGAGRGLGALFSRMLVEQHGAIPLLLDRISLRDANAALAALTESERQRWKIETLLPELQARSLEEKVTPVELEKEYRDRIDRAELQKNLNILARLAPGTRYYNCDITDPVSFKDVLSEIFSEFGYIDGIVHFAGIEESRRIEDKTSEEFSKIFATKASSAAALWKSGILKKDAIMVFASSVIGRFGNIGQCDYAAASAYLSAFANALSGKGIRAIAADMSAYDEFGMSMRGSVKKYLEECGVKMLYPEEGMQALLDEITYGNKPEVMFTAELGTIDSDHQLFCNTSFSGNGSGELPLIPYISEYIKGHAMTAIKNYSISSDPYLEDHKIKGKPYIPGNMGLETFAETVNRMRELNPEYLENICFHYPIKLFKNRPEAEVIIKALESPEGICQMKMQTEFNTGHGNKNRINEHFSASYSSKKPRSKWPMIEKPSIPAKKDLKADSAAIYDSFFQGPRFRVLHGILSVDKDSVTAIARKPHIGLWEDEKKLFFRPLVFEALFQACAWRDLTFESMIYLPCSIKAAMICPNNEVPNEFYIYGKLTEKKDNRNTIYDAWAFDREGNLLAELSGYEMIPTEEL